MHNNRTGLRLMVLLAVALSPVMSFAASAFDNADFEKGDFTNWPVHEGWSLHGGVIGGAYDTQTFNHPTLFGDFTANTARTDWLSKRYTGKEPKARVDRLVSAPFKITKPYLTFFFHGNLTKGKTIVGVDVNGDGKADVELTRELIRAWSKRIDKGIQMGPANERLYRAALDLSPHIGKTGRFMVTIKNRVTLNVDDLRLESAPHAWAVLTGTRIIDKKGEVRVKFYNPFNHDTKARIRIKILDELGAVLKDEKKIITVAGNGPAENVFTFSPNFSRHYRIRITSTTEDGTPAQFIRYRAYADEMKINRPFVNIETGWEMTKSKDKGAILPPPDAKWISETPMRAKYGFGYRFWPFYGKLNEYSQVWYRRNVRVPANFTGKRIYLNVIGGGASLLAPIINGKIAAENIIWEFADYAYDITDYIKRGEDNEIIMRFRNCDNYLRDENLKPLKAYRKYHHVRYGLLGNLRLENRPNVTIKRTYVDSYWRKRKLAVRYDVHNTDTKPRKVRLVSSVYSADGKCVLKLTATEATVPAGKTITVAIEKPWANPIPWFPSNPKLLRLETALTSNGEKETTQTRFGFREIWVKDKRIYINDWPVRLMEGTMTLGENFAGTKRWWGQNATRSMQMSWEHAMFSDETGVLTKGVWEDLYPPLVVPTKTYWDSFMKFQIDRVKSRYNHPGIWLWSVGNELGGHGHVRHANVRDAFIDGYTRLIKKLMSIDPQRPVISHGEADFFGASSIWCVHYPYEYSYAYDHPNDAHMLSLKKNIMVWGPHPPYKNDKPLYLGEAFSGGNLGPDWLGAIGGDKVYTRLGVFDAWKQWYIERQRAYREDAITGWEPFEVFRYINNFYPIEIYPIQYNHNFYAGETIERDIRIWNDTDHNRPFALAWSFGAKQSGKIDLPLKKGQTTITKIKLRMPAVSKRTDLPFHLTLTVDGKPVNPRWGFWKGTYSVLPRPRINRAASTMALDECEEAMLEFFGVKAQHVSAAKQLPPKGILFVKDSALSKKQPGAKDIGKWVSAGGTAFVLSTGLDSLELPIKLYSTQHPNTRAWKTADNNPLTKDMRAEDFIHWGPGDFRVSTISYIKPANGAFRVLLEAGDNSGLRLSPLIQVSHGKGRYVLCSLKLAEKYKVEPATGLLIGGVFKLHDKPQTTSRRIGALLSNTLTEHLITEGWEIDDLATKEKCDLSQYDTVWVDGELAKTDTDALKKFVETGGTLIISRLTPETLEPYRKIVGNKIQLTHAPQGKAHGGELLKIGPCYPLEGLSNFDFWWKHGMYGRGGPEMKITARTAEYVINPRGAEVPRWTQPLALTEIKLGKGVVVLDQIRWEEAVSREGKARRALSTFMTNLGVSWTPRATEVKINYAPVAVKANYAPAKGWIKGLPKSPALLSKRAATLAKIPFAFDSTDRIVLLGGINAYKALPKTMRIAVNTKAARLHLLHSSARGYIDFDQKKKIFEYRIALKRNGKTYTEVVPIRYAQQVDDCLGTHEPLQSAAQVSLSDNDGITTYLYSWKNPKPDATIAYVDVVSMDAKVLPIILGITAELPSAAKKSVLAKRRAQGQWSMPRDRASVMEKGRIWAYAGPFPCSPIKGLFPKKPFGSFLQVFGPEKGIDLEASYRGKGRSVSWKKYVEDFPKKPDRNYMNWVDRMKLLEFAHNEPDTVNYTVYFFTKVYSPKRQRLIMAYGSDDSSRVWINGKLVHQIWLQRGSFLGEDCVSVVLNKGWNNILVKLLNTFGDGAFGLDFKPFSPELIKAWKNKSGSLGPAPSAPLVYDAWGTDEPELPGSNVTHKGSLSEVLRIEANGNTHILDGRINFPDAAHREGDVMTVNFTKAKGAGVSIPTPKGTGGFKTGTFKISFSYSKGAASSHLMLAGRNAGGDNLGDTHIFLLGGYPSPSFGGEKDKKPLPYQVLRIFIERKVGYIPWAIPLKGKLDPGKWHDIKLTWDDAKGIVLYIDGQLFWSKKDYTGPAFAYDTMSIALVGDVYKRGHGKISFKNVVLVDRILK